MHEVRDRKRFVCCRYYGAKIFNVESGRKICDRNEEWGVYNFLKFNEEYVGIAGTEWSMKMLR